MEAQAKEIRCPYNDFSLCYKNGCPAYITGASECWCNYVLISIPPKGCRSA